MMVFLIIITVIVFIALLRFGIQLRYNENGLDIWLRVGFLSFKLYPVKKKKVKKKKKKTDLKVLAELKPKNLNELKALLHDLKNRLIRIKRRFLIKRLEIEYTAASNDPSSTAITFGRANVLRGFIWKLLHDNFKIKHSDFKVLADFESNRQKISLNIVVTIAVWEALCVFFTLLPLLTATGKSSEKSKLTSQQNSDNGAAAVESKSHHVRKEDKKNG